MTVYRPPLTLCIQLKRFTFHQNGFGMGGNGKWQSRHYHSKHGRWSGGGGGGSGRKITKPIEFPLQLKLPLSDGRTCDYQLMGFVTHWGQSATSGHYTACIQKPIVPSHPHKRSPNQQSPSPTVRWFHADDSFVEPISEEGVLRRKSDAYLLFYARKTVPVIAPTAKPSVSNSPLHTHHPSNAAAKTTNPKTKHNDTGAKPQPRSRQNEDRSPPTEKVTPPREDHESNKDADSAKHSVHGTSADANTARHHPRAPSPTQGLSYQETVDMMNGKTRRDTGQTDQQRDKNGPSKNTARDGATNHNHTSPGTVGRGEPTVRERLPKKEPKKSSKDQIPSDSTYKDEQETKTAYGEASQLLKDKREDHTSEHQGVKKQKSRRPLDIASDEEWCSDDDPYGEEYIHGPRVPTSEYEQATKQKSRRPLDIASDEEWCSDDDPYGEEYIHGPRVPMSEYAYGEEYFHGPRVPMCEYDRAANQKQMNNDAQPGTKPQPRDRSPTEIEISRKDHESNQEADSGKRFVNGTTADGNTARHHPRAPSPTQGLSYQETVDMMNGKTRRDTGQTDQQRDKNGPSKNTARDGATNHNHTSPGTVGRGEPTVRERLPKKEPKKSSKDQIRSDGTYTDDQETKTVYGKASHLLKDKREDHTSEHQGVKKQKSRRPLDIASDEEWCSDDDPYGEEYIHGPRVPTSEYEQATKQKSRRPLTIASDEEWCSDDDPYGEEYIHGPRVPLSEYEHAANQKSRDSPLGRRDRSSYGEDDVNNTDDKMNSGNDKLDGTDKDKLGRGYGETEAPGQSRKPVRAKTTKVVLDRGPGREKVERVVGQAKSKPWRPKSGFMDSGEKQESTNSHGRRDLLGNITTDPWEEEMGMTESTSRSVGHKNNIHVGNKQYDSRQRRKDLVSQLNHDQAALKRKLYPNRWDAALDAGKRKKVKDGEESATGQHNQQQRILAGIQHVGRNRHRSDQRRPHRQHSRSRTPNFSSRKRRYGTPRRK